MNTVVIAGTHSGAGKTTVTAAVMRLMTGMGLSVAPFKAGPDYIDPKFHESVTGNYSYNLDSWLIEEDTLKHLYYKNSNGHDISVIEGVMGLFDGLGDEGTGSTAHLAAIIGSPVILVVDARGMSGSIAALINGFSNFDERINIAGVILNNVSGEKHYRLLKRIIDKQCKTGCLGYMPFVKDTVLESRHLGLVPAEELEDIHDKIELLAKSAKETIDIDGILKTASLSRANSSDTGTPYNIPKTRQGLKIAIARDKAFSFYYRDNIDLMQESGIELVAFSPLQDRKIPDNVHGIYLGGGFPEIFAEGLSINDAMRSSLNRAAQGGMPVYAECGGLMYLAARLVGLDKKAHPMASVFNCDTVMTERLQHFGYVEIQYRGITFRGHEFHHSTLTNINDSDITFNYTVKKAGRAGSWQCGLSKYNVLAGYPHVHFYSSSDFFQKVIELFRSN